MTRSGEHDAGSLTVVGAGIRPGLQVTPEARVRIEGADRVLYLLAELAPDGWVANLNPASESLRSVYVPERPHDEVYEALIDAMLTEVRGGNDVCVITYGNPAVFDQSSHEAVRRARAEGFRAAHAT